GGRGRVVGGGVGGGEGGAGGSGGEDVAVAGERAGDRDGRAGEPEIVRVGDREAGRQRQRLAGDEEVGRRRRHGRRIVGRGDADGGGLRRAQVERAAAVLDHPRH